MAGQIGKLLTHTMVYGLGNFISKGLMFLLMPLLTNTISPDEYGKFGIAQTFIGLAEVFFMVGMRQAILRYRVKEGCSPEEVFSAGMHWIFIACAVFTAALVLLRGPVDRLLTLDSPAIFRSMLFILVLDAMAVGPFAWLQSTQRSHYYVGLRLAHVAVYFTFCFYFIILKKQTGVNAVLLANIGASTVQLLFCIPVFLKNLRFTLNRGLMQRMIAFGLPYIPNVVFVIVIDLIDRILLARLMDHEAVGQYSAACKLAAVMFLAVSAFQTAWQPFFLSHLKSGDTGSRLFSRVLTYYFLVTALIFISMGLFYPEIASFSVGGFSVIGAGYRQGLAVIPVILLAYVFCGIYTNFIVGIYAKEKTIYIPFITFVGAFLNVSVNFIAIPRFGIMGAALTTLLSYAAIAALLYPISMRLFYIRYEWGRILKITLITGALFLAGTIAGNVWIKLILALSFLPMLYLARFFNDEEKARVRKWILRT
ncbi:MAG: oligosaccharide flippase family protein [Fibrobacterota bacterium]